MLFVLSLLILYLKLFSASNNDLNDSASELPCKDNNHRFKGAWVSIEDQSLAQYGLC
jgi:hypothetical protein